MAGWELIYEPRRVKIGEVAEILVKTAGKALDLRYGSTVYVAYLTPGCRLLNVYGLQLMTGECPIAAVARDAQSQKWMCQVLVGEAAELLMLSVVGRLSWEPVSAANPLRALQARSVLAFGIEREPGFSEAYAAAALWGDFIYPWFGATALGEDGRLLLDLPEYAETLDLPMVVNVAA